MRKIALILLLLCQSFFALELDNIEKTMQTNIDKALLAIKNNKDKTKAANEIFTLFDPIFDFELMAKLSLSKKFNSLSEQEKQIYNKAFEKQLKTSFTNKLSLYTNQELKVKGGKKTKENRYELLTQMVVDGELKNIIFKFYDNKQSWLIYDVDLLGVSIVQTYRSQFKDLLEKGSFDDILKSLENVSFD